MNLETLLYYCENIEDIDVCISLYEETAPLYYGQGCDVPEDLMYYKVDKYVLEKYKGKVLMYIYLQG